MPWLSCPNCATAMALSGDRMTCETGHAFDVARQGYVSLLRGDHKGGTADTAAMVEARAAFLAAGHYAGIAALAARLGTPALDAGGPRNCAVDLGAGTGYYLAKVLDASDGTHAGLALDVSKFAARRAARAHPRIGSVVADAWQSLPIRGRAASLVLNVFAPRNPAEMHRILRPDGRAVVIAPEPAHLAELVAAHGLLNVDERKRERIVTQFAGRFEIEAEQVYGTVLSLAPEQAASLVDMGPNAWHAASRSGAVPGGGTPGQPRIEVTVAVRAYVLRPI